jgi:hypothetical protein
VVALWTNMNHEDEGCVCVAIEREIEAGSYLHNDIFSARRRSLLNTRWQKR